MKKIYAAAFIIIIIPFLIPILVKAYTPPSTLPDLKNWYASFGYTNIDSYIESLYNNSIVSNKQYAICRPNDDQSGTQKVIIFIYENKNGVFRGQSSGNDAWIFQEINGTNQSYNSVYYVLNYDFTNHSASKLNEGSGSGFMIAGSGAMSSYVFHLTTDEPVINFDNVNYMPSLPTPKPRVDYVSSWNPVTLINNVINPVVPYQLTYDPATAITGMMYVETYIKFSRPSLINVSLSGVIDTYNDVWSDPVYINTMESQTLLSDLSTVTTPHILDLSAYNQDWEDFKDSVTVSYTFDDNVPTALKTTYQDVFENKFNCVGLGGNNFALYQRYFIIDSNQNVYCGDWYVWNSGRVSKVKSDDVNKDFKPGEQPNGTINVVQPDYVNNNSDNYAPSNGTSTGNDGLLTIVNNLVPNYPDYPTAVSYNHDHVLTQFITTSKQLPGFFGSFGDFLKECFSFIDSSVWTVICTGFSCCIVIMIIKVL